ncbi:SdpI family protein [Microtetraspora malaysiensis]|uniref:SdpI family protein n=1 Tax=Microtetraspora malaysiensis TaxID=161358 RepID=UPI003D948FFC
MFGGASLGALALGLLGRLRRLRRNGAFGVRTQKSMASDEAWQDVHAKFAPFAFAIAVTWAVTAAIPFVAGAKNTGPPVFTGIALGLILLAWGAIWSHRGMNNG